MSYEVAKKNRLRGKFDFTPRDWTVELDGLEDHPPIPFRNGRPRWSTVVWERERDKRPDLNLDESEAG